MIKNIITFVTVALIGISASAQEGTPVKTDAVETKVTLQFDKEVHDYGEIEFASDGTCKFQFTNTGADPLMLSNVKASCGCTTPEWTKDPVKPGEKGEITVKYNTRSAGNFNKTVTVYSNGLPSPIILRIKGTVKPQSAIPQEVK